MGLASLGGHTFRLDPTSINWTFSSKVSDTPTVGGKVVQVFGTSISDIVVDGTFGVGGWEEQEDFLASMKAIADEQVADYAQTHVDKNPLRFLYPPKEWDFLVYLKSYTNPAGSKSVVHDNSIVAPKWSLTLLVVEDNSGLRQVAENAYIARLAKGLGWKKTEYNGPGVPQLDGLTVEEYLSRRYGVGDQPSGNQEPGGVVVGTPVTPGEVLTMAEIAPLVAKVGLTGEAAAIAIAIAMAESSGDPNAHNPNASTGDNSYGLWQINMLGDLEAERQRQFGIDYNEDLKIPEINAKAMMIVSGNGTNWRPWSVYKSGDYKKYLAEARRIVGV